jgi:hypothetical protein
MILTHLKFMMDFMNIFIYPFVVQESMQEIVPGVFNDCTAKAPRQNHTPVRRKYANDYEVTCT